MSLSRPWLHALAVTALRLSDPCELSLFLFFFRLRPLYFLFPAVSPLSRSWSFLRTTVFPLSLFCVRFYRFPLFWCSLFLSEISLSAGVVWSGLVCARTQLPSHQLASNSAAQHKPPQQTAARHQTPPTPSRVAIVPHFRAFGTFGAFGASRSFLELPRA